MMEQTSPKAVVKKDKTVTAARRGRRLVRFLDFLIPILILAAGTYVIRRFGLDLEWQAYFFRRGAWLGGKDPLCNFLYDYGTLPALITAIAGLVIFVASYFTRNLARYRKPGLFLALVMILAPGLLVNAIFKEHWGRPRPRNVTEFKGEYEFEQPLEYDESSPGNSFPSGHASMGFYFFTLYFLSRGRKKNLSPWIFLFSLSFGILMGAVRMAQGGHFVSDVLWSAGFVYLSSALLYHLLGMGNFSPQPNQARDEKSLDINPQ